MKRQFSLLPILRYIWAVVKISAICPCPLSFHSLIRSTQPVVIVTIYQVSNKHSFFWRMYGCQLCTRIHAFTLLLSKVPVELVWASPIATLIVQVPTLRTALEVCACCSCGYVCSFSGFCCWGISLNVNVFLADGSYFMTLITSNGETIKVMPEKIIRFEDCKTTVQDVACLVAGTIIGPEGILNHFLTMHPQPPSFMPYVTQAKPPGGHTCEWLFQGSNTSQECVGIFCLWLSQVSSILLTKVLCPNQVILVWAG